MHVWIYDYVYCNLYSTACTPINEKKVPTTSLRRTTIPSPESQLHVLLNPRSKRVFLLALPCLMTSPLRVHDAVHMLAFTCILY